MRSTFQSTYKASLGGVSDMSKLKSLAVHGKNKRPVCSDLGEMPGMALNISNGLEKRGKSRSALATKTLLAGWERKRGQGQGRSWFPSQLCLCLDALLGTCCCFVAASRKESKLPERSPNIPKGVQTSRKESKPPERSPNAPGSRPSQIECALYRGKGGDFILTGNAGNHLKSSCALALGWLHDNAWRLEGATRWESMQGLDDVHFNMLGQTSL